MLFIPLWAYLQVSLQRPTYVEIDRYCLSLLSLSHANANPAKVFSDSYIRHIWCVIIRDSRASIQHHLFDGQTLLIPAEPDFLHQPRRYFVATATKILASRKNMWSQIGGVLLKSA
jgi:hypothetical protein